MYASDVIDGLCTRVYRIDASHEEEGGLTANTGASVFVWGILQTDEVMNNTPGHHNGTVIIVPFADLSSSSNLVHESTPVAFVTAAVICLLQVYEKGLAALIDRMQHNKQ